MRVLLMGQFCSPSRQTTKEKAKKKERIKRREEGGWPGIFLGCA
jgi:hypothetical protein